MTLKQNWITGFVDGEGCFRASVIRNKTMRSGFQIQIEFVITQHKRDIELLKEIQELFQWGFVEKAKGKNSDSNCYRFRVRKLDDLIDKVIPFFDKYPLNTKKQHEFKLFKDLCFLLKDKVHLDFKNVLNLQNLFPIKKQTH